MPTTENSVTAALDLAWVRSQFPSLAQSVNGCPATFLDGPGGTQVPQRVIDAIADYLRGDNANTGGAYAPAAVRHDDRAGAPGDSLQFGAAFVFGQTLTALTLTHVACDWTGAWACR